MQRLNTSTHIAPLTRRAKRQQKVFGLYLSFIDRRHRRLPDFRNKYDTNCTSSTVDHALLQARRDDSFPPTSREVARLGHELHV